jgi:hypothetical protein
MVENVKIPIRSELHESRIGQTNTAHIARGNELVDECASRPIEAKHIQRKLAQDVQLSVAPVSNRSHAVEGRMRSKRADELSSGAIITEHSVVTKVGDEHISLRVA